LWRKIEEWEWWDDHNTTRLFIVLVLMANIEDKTWKDQVVPRGSFITSLKHISQKSGLTLQQIRTSLKRLKSTQEITIKTTNRFTLIKVNKYDLYHNANTQPNNQLTNKQQTNNKQITTTKECKNDKNDKNNPPTPQGVATKIEFPMRGDFKDFDDWYPNCFLNMEGMSINRKTEEVVGAYYYLKYITCHPEREMRKRLIEGSFKEKDRDEKWRKVRSKWIEIAKLDMLNDFTSDAFEWMRESGEVIKNPLAYLREVKNNDKGYEV